MIKNIPIIGDHLVSFYSIIKTSKFSGSSNYWENRYKKGENSGLGSYGKFAEFKAEVLNKFVAENNITSVIEFGCGDGNQLLLAKYPKYLGFDVSSQAISLCKKKFKSDSNKSFELTKGYNDQTAQLSLSLDVIYHLVEDDVFNSHMNQLFDASESFVIIYASNTNESISAPSPHVRHRKFTDWVVKEKPEWELLEYIPNKYPCKNGDDVNGSFADFYFYRLG